MSGSNSPLQLGIHSFPEQTPLSEALFNRFSIRYLYSLKVTLRQFASELKLQDVPQQIPSEEELVARIRTSTKYANEEIKQATKNHRVSKLGSTTSTVQLSTLNVEGFSSAMYHKNEAQDVFAIHRDEKSIIACLCDGVSGSKFSRDGAILVSQFLSRRTAELLDRSPDGRKNDYAGPIDPKFMGQLHAELQWNMLNWAHRLGISVHEAGRHVFTTTIQLLIITPKETAILAIGDGFFTHNSSHEVLPQFVKRDTHGKNTPELFVMPFLKEDYRFDKENDGHTFHIAGHWPTDNILRVGVFTDGACVCPDFEKEHGARFANWMRDSVNSNEKSLAQNGGRTQQRIHLTWPDFDEIWSTPTHEIINNLAAANEAIRKGGGAAAFADHAITPWAPFADDFAGVMVKKRPKY